MDGFLEHLLLPMLQFMSSVVIAIIALAFIGLITNTLSDVIAKLRRKETVGDAIARLNRYTRLNRKE